MRDKILVTGGTGYLGSHVIVELGRAGYAPVALDGLAGRAPATLAALYALSGVRVPVVDADVRDPSALREVFRNHPIRAVIHCAGVDPGDDAAARPLAYYGAQVAGAMTLAEVMAEAGVGTLVASSSAAVYGVPARLPAVESASLAPLSTRGRGARMVEEILTDVATANPNWRIALLRSFAVAGAHPSGALGPPAGAADLVSRLAAVASGERTQIEIAGDDWPTADGTALSDYVHVVDVARGYVAALRHLATATGVEAFNLGTGRAQSELAVVTAFEHACGRRLSRVVVPRRAAAVGALYASTAKAESLLQWRAEHGIAVICEDAWRWQRRAAAVVDAAPGRAARALTPRSQR
ncbi:MAG: UDP-glucose 4-epimerase GalE [Betaproteobacteria bacterium]|nr:UDP-glucose 4-epimerase GalE [Betaproteobacteria bacterium]